MVKEERGDKGKGHQAQGYCHGGTGWDRMARRDCAVLQEAAGPCPHPDLCHHFPVGFLLSGHLTLTSAVQTLPWPYTEPIGCHSGCAVTLQAHRCLSPHHTQQEWRLTLGHLGGQRRYTHPGSVPHRAPKLASLSLVGVGNSVGAGLNCSRSQSPRAPSRPLANTWKLPVEKRGV